MPQPNNKRLRSAKYSESRSHFSMLNSVVDTKRTPIWDKIIEARDILDKRVDQDVRVLGGTGHSLGDAASTGTIQIQSDGADNRKLVLGENTISFHEFTLPNSNEFVATTARQRNFKITPTGNVSTLLKNGKIKVGDIFEVSGGVDNTNDGTIAAAKDERWINSVYRVTHIKDNADADASANPANAVSFIIDNDDNTNGADLTNANGAGTASVVPDANADIKFRKLVRINKIASQGVDFFLFRINILFEKKILCILFINVKSRKSSLF